MALHRKLLNFDLPRKTRGRLSKLFGNIPKQLKFLKTNI